MDADSSRSMTLHDRTPRRHRDPKVPPDSADVGHVRGKSCLVNNRRMLDAHGQFENLCTTTPTTILAAFRTAR